MKEIRTIQELDEILDYESNKKVLIKFFGNWCQPCKLLGHTLLDLEGTYTDDYIFLEVDTDESDELVEGLGVYNLPTIVIFKGQDEIYRHSGLLTRTQITSLLSELKDK